MPILSENIQILPDTINLSISEIEDAYGSQAQRCALDPLSAMFAGEASRTFEFGDHNILIAIDVENMETPVRILEYASRMCRT